MTGFEQRAPRRLGPRRHGRLGNALLLVTLITLAAVFLFPFGWMVLVSMKTNEEVSERIFPALPRFRASSPYTREPVEIARPPAVPKAAFDAVVPLALDDARAAAGGDEAVASVLVDRAVADAAASVWEQPVEAARAALRERFTAAAIAAARDDRTARLELLGFELRTLDSRLHLLASGSAFADGQTSVSSGADLTASPGDSVRVSYRFTSPSDAPITLRRKVALPVPWPQVHRLSLSILPDNSWHLLEADVEVEGRRWRSERGTPLAQQRATSITFQPPSFDDQTLRAKRWVSLVDAGPSAATAGMPAGEAVLTLRLRPSSTAGAIWAKATRNYREVFNQVPFWRYIANSLMIALLTMAGAVLSSSFVGYAFARLHWPGRNLAMLILLSTMMLPPQVMIVPSFVIVRWLGWYNTFKPLWVPSWLGSAFFVFLMVQHLRTIPRELEEAARIDGLGYVRTWLYIILPQTGPALAAIAILSFIGAWNDFLGPLLYLRDQARFPLSLGLYDLQINNLNEQTVLVAGNVLMTLPVIVIFFLFQRAFVEGTTTTGMKG